MNNIINNDVKVINFFQDDIINRKIDKNPNKNVNKNNCSLNDEINYEKCNFHNNNEKNINILGTNNRYQIKKLINKDKPTESKNRVKIEKWNIDAIYFESPKQLELLKLIKEKNYEHYDYESNILKKELECKIHSYKQQDINKNHLDDNKLITLINVVDKLIDVQLKCYYCFCDTHILYEKKRETKQWSVDRIDNDLGHNFDNFVIACLECNLKRRRRTKEDYLFTKQLNIVKQS